MRKAEIIKELKEYIEELYYKRKMEEWEIEDGVNDMVQGVLSEVLGGRDEG